MMKNTFGDFHTDDLKFDEDKINKKLENIQAKLNDLRT